MTVKVGSLDVADVRVGAAQAVALYAGAVKVWPSAPSHPLFPGVQCVGARVPAYALAAEQFARVNDGSSRLRFDAASTFSAWLLTLPAGTVIVLERQGTYHRYTLSGTPTVEGTGEITVPLTTVPGTELSASSGWTLTAD